MLEPGDRVTLKAVVAGQQIYRYWQAIVLECRLNGEFGRVFLWVRSWRRGLWVDRRQVTTGWCGINGQQSNLMMRGAL